VHRQLLFKVQVTKAFVLFDSNMLYLILSVTATKSLEPLPEESYLAFFYMPLFKILHNLLIVLVHIGNAVA
jgi:hypothetical protein